MLNSSSDSASHSRASLPLNMASRPAVSYGSTLGLRSRPRRIRYLPTSSQPNGQSWRQHRLATDNLILSMAQSERPRVQRKIRHLTRGLALSSRDCHQSNFPQSCNHSFLSLCSHLFNIPSHRIKLGLACTNQVSYLRDIRDAFVTVELASGMRQVLTTFGCWDAVDAAEDGAIEGEDAGALEKVFKGGGWGFG